MKDFEGFARHVAGDTAYKEHIEQRLRREIAGIPAASLLGQASVAKLIGTVSDVGIEISLTMLRAYHEWAQAAEKEE